MISLLLLTLVLLLVSPIISHAIHAPDTITRHLTQPSNVTMRFTPLPNLNFDATCPAFDAKSSAPRLNSDIPTVTLRTKQVLTPMVGFGSALTETAAYNLLSLKAHNATRYQEVLISIFASPENGGIGLSLMRYPISSTDLSLPTQGWSYDDVVGDVDLTNFNLDHAMQYQIPVLRDIKALEKTHGAFVQLLACPWSPVAWMKDTCVYGSGSIKDELYPVYARYLVKIMQAYQDMGMPFAFLTLQNEPELNPNSYPGAIVSPKNESVLAALMKPLMRAANLTTLIGGFDFNWDRFQYPIDLMSIPEGKDNIDFIGYHGYGGNVSAQEIFHRQFPDVPILFTEYTQTGNEQGTADFRERFFTFFHHIYYDTITNWARSSQHWSMVVNKALGPHSGGCGSCSGILTIDADDFSVPPYIRYNNEYYLIAHFSASLPARGSYHVVANITGSTTGQAGDISVLGFTAGAQGRVLQLSNENAADQSVLIFDESLNRCFTYVMPAQSFTTLQWQASSTSTVESF